MKLPCHAAKLLRHAARKRLLRFKAGILQGFRGLIEAAGLSPAGYPPHGRLLASLFARASLRGPHDRGEVARDIDLEHVGVAPCLALIIIDGSMCAFAGPTGVAVGDKAAVEPGFEGRHHGVMHHAIANPKLAVRPRLVAAIAKFRLQRQQFAFQIEKKRRHRRAVAPP